MKKLLVLSDSHGSRQSMADIVRKEAPDIIYHLGDYIRDSQWLRSEFFHIPVFGVVGNCDYGSVGPERIVDEIEGVRIFACHGHRQNVKYGLLSLEMAAREEHADLCLFGHTHVRYLDDEGEVTLLNPGSCGAATPTYAIVLLQNGRAECKLCIGGD